MNARVMYQTEGSESYSSSWSTSNQIVAVMAADVKRSLSRKNNRRFITGSRSQTLLIFFCGTFFTLVIFDLGSPMS